MSNKMEKDSSPEVKQLRAKLLSACQRKDTGVITKVLKQVVTCMTQSIDVTPLLPHIIREVSATSDMVQKKLVYLYIRACVEADEDWALHTVNTFVKDATLDPNPIVRGLAIRSISSIRLEKLVEYWKDLLIPAIADASSYVRSNAVLACKKLYKLKPQVFKDLELEKLLEQGLFDINGQVSCNCLHVLDEIHNGRYPLTKQIVQSFLPRLTSMDEWSQCSVLQKLSTYTTQDVDECYEILNYLDNRLKHQNQAVVLATVKIFLQLSFKLNAIQSTIFDRIRAVLLALLANASNENTYVTLTHVSAVVSMRPNLFRKDHKHFYLRNKDPLYLKKKKLEILTQVVTEGNVKDIVSELLVYMEDVEICEHATRSMGEICRLHPFSSKTCVQSLLMLLQYENTTVTTHILQLMQELLPLNVALQSSILPQLSETWYEVKEEGRAALVWIYGAYGKTIEEAPYHLEEVVDSLDSVSSLTLKMNLISATVKLFFARPPECLPVLGKMFNFFLGKEENVDLRERALFYYRLLKGDLDKAQQIIISDESHPSQTPKSGDCYDIHDYQVAEFNSFSIVHGRPSLYKKETVTEQRPIEVAQICETPVEDILGVGEWGLCVEDTLERQTFIPTWKQLQYSESTLKVEFSELPPRDEIIEAFNNRYLFNVAASPQNSKEWKFYFYAQERSTDELYLLEVLAPQPHEQPELTVNTRCEKDTENLFQDFLKAFIANTWNHKNCRLKES